MIMDATNLQCFCDLLQNQQTQSLRIRYPDLYKRQPNYCNVTWHVGSKYTRVDVGTSGKYMIENETGKIYGIKAYGVINRKKQYGDLSTMDSYDWSGYTAVLRR